MVALASLPKFAVDPVIVPAIVDAVESAMTMSGAKVKCVAVASVPTRDPGHVTGMIGVHGNVSGFVTVNLAERAAIDVVGGLLQDKFDCLSPQIIDGVGELTNLVAGGIKKGLSGTDWGFNYVTVPSVIVGQKYQIAYCRGLHYVSATFEHENQDALMLDDRLVHVAVSLIRV